MLLIVSFLCAHSISTVDAHGWMSRPQIRGRYGKFQYEPQSLGAVGPGGDITICGRDGPHNHAKGDAITKIGAPGSEFEFEASISAHHFGHMIVRVCPWIDGTFTHQDLKKCIRLKGKGAGPKPETWDLSPQTGKKLWNAALPSKAELAALGTKVEGTYTIQWRWNTANSCQASDTLADQSNCNEQKCCSEVFTNCADVTFDGIPNKAPEIPKDPPAVAPPAPPPAPTPPASGTGCLWERNCAKSAWCEDKNMQLWCSQQNQQDCVGAVQCRWGGGGSEPEPEPEPELGHEVVPTEKAKGMVGVKDFCGANRKWFCGPDTVAVGADICDCKPTGTKPAGTKPEPEPESKPEPEPKPEPVAPPTANAGKPWSVEQENPANANKLPVLSTSACKTICTNTCNNYALEYSVGINQGWDTSIAPNCQCRKGDVNTPIYIAGCVKKSHTTLLETVAVHAVGKSATKFSRVAASVNSNGQPNQLGLDEDLDSD